VAHAAFLLGHTFSYYPAGTVHVAVVDPGVGSSRRGIAIRTENHFLVGPDNGILSLCADADRMVEARELSNEDLWHEPVSRTFHGRDIFSPVGAAVASGADFAEVGNRIEGIERLGLSAMVFQVEGRISGRVVYIDSFGNLVTNIREDDLRDLEPLNKAEVEIEETVIEGIVDFYRASLPGTLIALFGSIGFLEISVVEGNAAAELDVGIGAQVVVRRG
jgi:S-adenosylmethionine hydrolase